MTRRPNNRSLQSTFIALSLFAAAIGLYWVGLNGGFVFDDFPNLVWDADWRMTALTRAQIEHVLYSGSTGGAGRPLALLSFGLNHSFTGADPFWLKFTNVVFHGANAVLVCRLVRRLLRGLEEDGAHSARADVTAWIVAAAWLLHPLQVSAVLYVVQRMELGAATGILVALSCYVQARTNQLAGRIAWPWFLGAGLSMLLGFGFKETAALTPADAFVLELCVFRFATLDRAGRSRGWIAFYCVGAAAALILLVVVAIPQLAADPTSSPRNFTPGQRLLTQGPVLVLYLQQILIPLPSSMTFFYDNFIVSTSLWAPPWTAFAFAILASLVAVAAAAWRRMPLVTCGIGWFFVGHALTSNVIPLELAFEHRNYMPLLGILLALVQPLGWLSRRWPRRSARLAAGGAVAALALLCLSQAVVWGNPLRLAAALEARNPTSPRASYGLGERLLAQAGNDVSSRQWSAARAQFAKAATLAPPSPLAWQALIIMDGHAGAAIPQTTWDAFGSALTTRVLSSEGATALRAVIDCRIATQCAFDDSALMRVLLLVVDRNPGDALVLTQYANFAWNVLDDPALAVAVQRDAAALAPQNPAFRTGLAKFLLASGEAGEGIRLLQALEQDNRVPRSELQALRALAASASPNEDDAQSQNGNTTQEPRR